MSSTGVFPVGFYSQSLSQTLFFHILPMFVGCFYAYMRAVHSTAELRTEQQTLTLNFLALLKALVLFEHPFLFHQQAAVDININTPVFDKLKL